ncbi:unnamed protein product [Linum tenue]|uniref:Uncharacterized protein n=1 Tax=Linum tenue TaxID=586396 RepID=A0AAV0RNT8_9ROSI|nr:unnamed protein product [Linum tenue]
MLTIGLFSFSLWERKVGKLGNFVYHLVIYLFDVRNRHIRWPADGCQPVSLRY